jgi:hypothetical protein
VNETTGVPVADPEKGFYGDGLYDFMMGLQNSFTFKNLSLNLTLDYRKGGVMYTGTGDLALFTGNSYATTYNDRRPFVIPNSVFQPLDASGNPMVDAQGKPVYRENMTVITEANYDSYWYPTTNLAMAYQERIIDRSFFKLRDITLSYNLPASWASRIRSTGLSISVYGRNFLLWRSFQPG